MPEERSFRSDTGALSESAVMELHVPEATSRLSFPVFLYILTVILPIQVSLGGLVLSSNRLLLLLLVVPLTVNLIMGRYGRLLAVDILFFLHIIWGVVALAVNNPDRVVEFMGSNSIEFVGGYVLGRAFIRKREDFFGLCKLLAVLAVLSLPFALYETLTGNPILIRMLGSLPGVSSVPIAHTMPRYGLERVQVFFGHPIHYGLFTGMLISIVFIGFKGMLSNALRYGLAFVILVCTLLSLSSGPLLALVMQCGLILWAWLFRGTRSRWLILLCVAIVAYVVVDLLSNRTPFRVFLHYATMNAHTAYWRALIFEWGMVNVWANPLFGLGLNDWVRPVYMHSGSMDNFWLLMAVRYGIPGFLFLAVGYGTVLWKVGRRDLDASEATWQLRRAWMISMLGLTFALFTVHVWGSLYSFVFFFFGAGIWFITVELDEEEVSSAQSHIQGSASRLAHAPEDSSYTRFPPSHNIVHRRTPSPPIRTDQ